MSIIHKELDRLIGNAIRARADVQSEWGKNYWDEVLAYLLRVGNRLN